jgi:hypothetical protein
MVRYDFPVEAIQVSNSSNGGPVKAIFLPLSLIFSAPFSFAGTNCAAPALHAKEVAKCHFSFLIGTRSNQDLEKLRAEMMNQGFSDASNSEFPSAVFLRGTADRYTYLITTDLSKGSEFKTVVALISAKVDSTAVDREVIVEKVFTSDSF